jgi:hypothetical protein
MIGAIATAACTTGGYAGYGSSTVALDPTIEPVAADVPLALESGPAAIEPINFRGRAYQGGT